MSELLLEPILALCYFAGVTFIASLVTLAKVFECAIRIEKIGQTHDL